jgi:hypothetical protein
MIELISTTLRHVQHYDWPVTENWRWEGSEARLQEAKTQSNPGGLCPAEELAANMISSENCNDV